MARPKAATGSTAAAHTALMGIVGQIGGHADTMNNRVTDLENEVAELTEKLTTETAAHEKDVASLNARYERDVADLKGKNERLADVIAKVQGTVGR